jgi:hypothetical protein
MDNFNEMNSKYRNPTRQECEEQVRRTLMTENLRHGGNHHFKTAKDFMPIFEALYPASPSLVKQVQRAVKAMNMPKDADGYFLVDKTKLQMEQDTELSGLLKKSDASLSELENLDTILITLEDHYKDYIFQLISESSTLSGKYVTAIKTSNGILFLTQNKPLLKTFLEDLL